MAISNLYSPKQQEMLRHGNGRWNISSGATRSGKTYLDISFRIMNAILERKDKKGLTIICGQNYGTIERNVLIPMRAIYGGLVGYISRGNSKTQSTHVVIANEKVFLFGAGDSGRSDNLRGASVKYAYCDEVVTYSQDFFNLLKSRLDKPYSRCDCTCNPDNSRHWFKLFLDDNTVEKYIEHFTIDDNPFLDPMFVEALKNEYRGTVYYDRYILGKWVNAEGLVFPLFADSLMKDNNNYKRFMIDKEYKYREIVIGVDFGQKSGKNIFTACGILPECNEVHILDTHSVIGDSNGVDTEMISKEHFEFVQKIISKYPDDYISQSYCDHYEAVINSIRKYHAMNGSRHCIDLVDKASISLKEYIMRLTALFNNDKIKISEKCTGLIDSLSVLVYDDKNPDTIQDNNEIINDYYDSMRYSMSRFLSNSAYNL